MTSYISSYKKKLEKAICEYMSCPFSERYAEKTDELMKYWLTICEIDEKVGHTDTSSYKLTEDDISYWNSKMCNEDGTTGGHWSEVQTSNLATILCVKFEHITAAEWNVTCNMMYSDYYKVAQNMGVDTPEFYGWLAKAFLFDKDGPAPSEKLCAYYHYIVEAAK